MAIAFDALTTAVFLPLVVLGGSDEAWARARGAAQYVSEEAKRGEGCWCPCQTC